MLLGLLFAAALGAFHALSPGHGKTIVGAYLVGSRGTAKHAAFLSLTVTVRTRSASLRAVESSDPLQHDALDETLVDYTHDHAEQQSATAFMHSHGGGSAHTHFPPGA